MACGAADPSRCPPKKSIALTEETYETRGVGAHHCPGPGLVGDGGPGARTVWLGTAAGNRFLFQPGGSGALLLSATGTACVWLLGSAPSASAGLRAGSGGWTVVWIVTPCVADH